MVELTRSGGKIQVMEPAWSAPFLELGAIALQRSQPGKRRVYGLLLPTRSFAAILVALGAVVSHGPDTSTNAQAWKRELPPGAECWYPVSKRFVRCVITGAPRSELHPLQVQTLSSIPGAAAGTTISVPATRLSRLLPVDVDEESGGSKMYVKGRSVVERLFGAEESYAFYGERCLDVLICGVASDLYDEARFLEVCADSEHTSAIQLLRPRSFMGSRSGYRSEVVTSVQRPRPLGEQPRLVIFDGAYAYLQWWRVWRDATCVVILDESSPSRARHAAAMERLQSLQQRGTTVILPLTNQVSQIEFMAVDL